MQLYRTVLACSVATLLAACGGGSISIGDFDEDPFVLDPPRSSFLSATMTVSASTEPFFVGQYTTDDLLISSVFRFGDSPGSCRFRFHGLRLFSSGNERLMSGEIRYLPDSPDVRTTILFINGEEFRYDGTVGAVVDRANDRVTYSNVTLAGRNSITVTGSIPMRAERRPIGC